MRPRKQILHKQQTAETPEDGQGTKRLLRAHREVYVPLLRDLDHPICDISLRVRWRRLSRASSETCSGTRKTSRLFFVHDACVDGPPTAPQLHLRRVSVAAHAYKGATLYRCFYLFSSTSEMRSLHDVIAASLDQKIVPATKVNE